MASRLPRRRMLVRIRLSQESESLTLRGRNYPFTSPTEPEIKMNVLISHNTLPSTLTPPAGWLASSFGYAKSRLLPPLHGWPM